MRFKSKKENSAKKILAYVVVLLLIGGGVFMYFSPMFEKNAPTSSISGSQMYWNLKTPLRVTFSDDNAVKSYDFEYSDEENDEVELDTRVLEKSKGKVLLEVFPPKLPAKFVPKNGILKVDAYDTSKWNFFMGNKFEKELKIKIDRKEPIATVLSNTYSIKRGGSAIAVVEVKDENLKEAYIDFNEEIKFELIPFRKEGFFISTIAWPIYIKNLKRVNLVAIDKAGNKTITKVPLYVKEKRIPTKTDNLKIKDNFIENSKLVLTKSEEEVPEKNVDIFVKMNKDLREKNIQTIKDVVRKNMSRKMVKRFRLKPFKKLKAGVTFAGYGEKRYYYYKGRRVDTQWHLGADWASIKQAKIYTSNSGKVIFLHYLGIYGNSIIIDHGFGISTLYAHTSRSQVQLDQEVKAGQFIANTGSTGAVFGDHLHFGVLIQGIEVNPDEWLSKYWIRENITKVIKTALRVIDSK